MIQADYKSRLRNVCRHLSHKDSGRSTISPAGMASSSGGITLEYQDSIPKYPVPPLHQTLQKYLQHYQPYVSGEEFDRAKKVVDKFGKPGGTGELLQEKLEERRDSTDNWLSEWWREGFLKQRSPNVLHSAPGSLMYPQPFRGVDEQTNYAALGIAALASTISLLARRQFPPAELRGRPLCMEQYYTSVCSCRVPGRPMDGVFYHPVDRHDSFRHIIIIRRNHFFKLDILDEERLPLGLSDILEQLKIIVEKSQEPALPVGLLTAQDRDSWADAYTAMKEDPTNAQSLLDIQSSAFIICLDDTKDFSDMNEKRQHDRRWLLCGGRSTENAGNRWFDKTFMISIGTNGECGIYGDHTMADGALVGAISNSVTKFMEEMDTGDEPNPRSPPPPKELEFVLTDDLIHAIEKTGEQLDRILDGYQIMEQKFKSFGKTLMKSYGLHPDGFVQVAIQLAYWRIHGRLPVVYETSSLQGFKLGRMDHLRPVSVESAEFVKTMDESTVDPGRKLDRLMSALQVHKDLNAVSKAGQGAERHLFGLQRIAEENNIDASEFFQDQSWEKMSRVNIRASTGVGSMIKLTMSPVRYQPCTTGMWYSIRDDHVMISMNIMEGRSVLDLRQFMDALCVSFQDMMELASAAQKHKL